MAPEPFRRLFFDGFKLSGSVVGPRVIPEIQIEEYAPI
jgi:hypothetical protein